MIEVRESVIRQGKLPALSVRSLVAAVLMVGTVFVGASAEAAAAGGGEPPTTPTSTPVDTPTPTTASSAMPTVTPAQQTDACGAVLLKSDGTARICSFVDEFSGTTLNRAKWHVQTATLTGSSIARSCHMDSPNNVAVANGALRLTVRKLATPVQCAGKTAGYSSGQVSTFWKWSQQYGRFEARIRNTAATTKGLHEAFWLWPDARVYSRTLWPQAGEIDIVEAYSVYPNLAVPFLHYTWNDNGGPWPGVNTAWDCAAQRGVWNTYTLDWSATQLQILVNGKVCLTNTSGDLAFSKPYIMAFTQALGAAGNEYSGTAPLPATLEVDYVKVWK